MTMYRLASTDHSKYAAQRSSYVRVQYNILVMIRAMIKCLLASMEDIYT